MAKISRFCQPAVPEQRIALHRIDKYFQYQYPALWWCAKPESKLPNSLVSELSSNNQLKFLPSINEFQVIQHYYSAQLFHLKKSDRLSFPHDVLRKAFRKHFL